MNSRDMRGGNRDEEIVSDRSADCRRSKAFQEPLEDEDSLGAFFDTSGGSDSNCETIRKSKITSKRRKRFEFSASSCNGAT